MVGYTTGTVTDQYAERLLRGSDLWRGGYLLRRGHLWRVRDW